MANLRRVLRIAKEINNELRQAVGVSIQGRRVSGGTADRDMAGVLRSQKRIEKALRPDPVAKRRLL